MAIVTDIPVHLPPALDNGGAGCNLRHRRFGGNTLAVDGSDDWSAVLEAASAAVVSEGGNLIGGPGIYGFEIDAECAAPLDLRPGCVLRPANGVTVTLPADFRGSPGCLDTSLGGTFTFADGVGPVDPKWFGATAAAIQAAVASLPATGGTIDLRGLPDRFVIDADICALLPIYDRRPITFLWGPREVRVTTTQTVRSNHTHVLGGTTFAALDANGDQVPALRMFRHLSEAVLPAGGVITTKDSGTVTMANPADPEWAYLEVGSPLLIMGMINPLGQDSTTLDGAHGDSDTTITVASTARFPSSGYVRIADEIISYAAKTATTLTGCVRGFGGSTASSHSNGATVLRPTYEPYTVESISGATITLANLETVSFSSTAARVAIGHLNVRFEGTGSFVGHYTEGVDEVGGNGVAVTIAGSRRFYFGPGLTTKGWDHGGVFVEAGQDDAVYGHHENIGHPSLSLGANVWMFGRCKRGVVDVTVARGNLGVFVDDRSTSAEHLNGAPEDMSVVVRSALDVSQAIAASGLQRSRLEYHRAHMPNGGIGITLAAGQWGTNVAGSQIQLVCGITSPGLGVTKSFDIQTTAYADKTVTIWLQGAGESTYTETQLPEPTSGLPSTESGVTIIRPSARFNSFAASDALTLTDDITDAELIAIPVADTSQFPSRGYIQIGSEIIRYNATTPTSFTGTTRARGGTTASAHSSGASVYRAIAPGYNRGDIHKFFVYSASDFTLMNPLGPFQGGRLIVEIRNECGGAMGTITWGSEFRLAGAFTNPADAHMRSVTFVREARLWREESRTAADQPI